MKNKPIKIRRSWGVLNPVTKIKQSDKSYKRNREKRTVKKIIKEDSE